MDIGRIEKLFKKLMMFSDDERKLIVLMLDIFEKEFPKCYPSDYFVIAQHLIMEQFIEWQKQYPQLQNISFGLFINIFNGARINTCLTIMDEMSDDDVKLTVDVFRMVVKTPEKPHKVLEKLLEKRVLDTRMCSHLTIELKRHIL